MIKIDKGICPICGKPNNCSYEKGLIHEGCWCEKNSVPKELRDLVPDELKGKACICRACVEEYKKTHNKDIK